MKKIKLHWAIMICGCHLFLFASAANSTGMLPEQKQVFDDLVSKYMEFFNSRNHEGILSMYAEDARIKTEINGKEEFVTKEEYRTRLADNLEKWDKKKLKLVDYTIEELQIRGEVAIVEIEFRGKQGFFSGRRKGNIELKIVGSDWKITLDEF